MQGFRGIVGASLCSIATVAMAATSVATSVEVRDGDTFVLDGERIRLWGIDAPEMDQACDDGTGRPFYFGQVSTQRLIALLGASAPRCERVDTDRYGRTVARCAVGGEDLGAVMVRAGMAVDYPEYSGGAYRAEEEAAAAEGAGLWSLDCARPADWRRMQR